MSNELTRRDFIRLSGTATLGTVALGLAGCAPRTSSTTQTAPVNSTTASNGAAGGLLVYGAAEALPNQALDPIFHVTNLEIMVGGFLYNRLVRTDYDYNVYPMLAESWESNEDSTEFTFFLREAEFHDGRPFTAHDVAYTMRRLIDPELGSFAISRLAPSLDESGIEVLDERAIRFNLLRPDSRWVAIMGGYPAGIVPDGTTDFSQGIGTGPFRLKSWEPGRSFEVDRNPSYWRDGYPKLDGIRGIGASEEASRVQSVISGDTHLAEMLYASADLVNSSESAKVLESSPVHMQNIVMDQTVPPFDDIRVRQAMKLSLDRDRALAVSYLGFGVTARDVTAPDNDPFVTDRILSLNVDREEAARLLAEAGHPNGLDLTLKYSTEEMMTAAALGFQAGMEGGPIRIELSAHDASTYWDQVWLTEPFYMSEWFRNHPVDIMFDMLKSGAAWNETKFADPEFDDLLVASLGAAGDEHDRIVGQAMEIVQERSGLIVPAYRNRVNAANKDLQGVVFDPSTVLWLEEAYFG